MSVSGYLSDFSLLKVFQLLQDDKKTGLLSIQGLASAANPHPKYYFIWLHRGRIVTVVNRLDNRGLATLIAQRRYLSLAMTERLIRRCPADEPLGRFLRSQGVLTTKQLQILFAAQVVRQVSDLLCVPDGYFVFDPEAPIPKVEMTGLSVVATEVVLPALRLLKDRDAFQDKLPHSQSALVSLIRGQPHVRINQSEWNVWRLMDDNITLNQIAANLNLSLAEVQRIAFRLIFVGLAEEVPKMLSEAVAAEDVPKISESDAEDTVPEEPSETAAESVFPLDVSEAEKLSPSFFRHLISFLREVPKSS